MKSLDEVVVELVDRFSTVDDLYGHVCRPTRYQQCSHDQVSRASLLSRVADLVDSSTPPLELAGAKAGASGRRAPAGSPAPWSAVPAELIDEVQRGAVDYLVRAHRVLKLDYPTETFIPVPSSDSYVGARGPVCAACDHSSCKRMRSRIELAPLAWARSTTTYDVPVDVWPVEAMGRRALRRLPGLVLQLERVRDPLGVRIRKDGTKAPGRIEVDLRTWHARCKQLIGIIVAPEPLPRLPNPDHPSFGVDLQPPAPVIGPVCEEDRWCRHSSCAVVVEALDWSRWFERAQPGRRRIGPVCASCAHRSCARIRSGRQRLLPWTCPLCGSDSLRRDPITDEVTCLRPSCTDDDGERPTWQAASLTDASTDPWNDDDLEDL